MSLTLDALRQASGKRLVGRPRFVIGTATADSSNTNTLTDNTNLHSHARSGWHKNGYLLRYALNTTDRLRQVLEDNYQQGEVVLTPDYSDPVANGEPYEIWPFGYDPLTVEEAINSSMIRLRLPDELDITPVLNQRQYSLAAYPWLTSPKQIKGLYWLSGSGLGIVPYPVPDISVSQDLGSLTLNLLGDRTFDTTDALRLVVWRSAYSTGSVMPLVAGADTVNLPDDLELIEYVAVLTCLEILRAPYARRFGPRADKDRKAVIDDLQTQIRSFDERFGGARSWQLFRPTTERW